jgi:hypothetical protein
MSCLLEAAGSCDMTDLGDELVAEQGYLLSQVPD